jgi:hypothetical protein
MKHLLFIFLCLISLSAYGQDAEDRNLKFDSTDLKIIERADLILSDSSHWNRHDDRECSDDIANGKYSLYCALYKASVDVAGKYAHRRPAMQIVRFTLEKYANGRVKEHRLMDWNNHPATTFADVKKVLKESIAEVKKQLNES